MPAKLVILQFAKGDKIHPNPTNTAMLRAGDLAEHDFTGMISPLPWIRQPCRIDPRAVLFYNDLPFSLSPLLLGIALDAQEQMAEFFASDSTLAIDPDGSMPLFEVHIVPPLPEELNFIP